MELWFVGGIIRLLQIRESRHCFKLWSHAAWLHTPRDINQSCDEFPRLLEVLQICGRHKFWHCLRCILYLEGSIERNLYNSVLSLGITDKAQRNCCWIPWEALWTIFWMLHWSVELSQLCYTASIFEGLWLFGEVILKNASAFRRIAARSRKFQYYDQIHQWSIES
jgi:hypothetical protein